jgi:hypothetical protein
MLGGAAKLALFVHFGPTGRPCSLGGGITPVKYFRGKRELPAMGKIGFVRSFLTARPGGSGGSELPGVAGFRRRFAFAGIGDGPDVTREAEFQ